LGQPKLWPDRHFQNAFSSRTEEIVRFDDLIELESMRQQRQWIKAVFAAAWLFTSLDTDPHSSTTAIVFVFAHRCVGQG
jgi:hypothetical protein